ncbi:hypothetical protein [Desulfovibrio sp. TomC]|uniref:hypothetical protein n=1 Tax=Desulfovibrio sp. TomC TaxID=1562888 RepID=UPI0005734316|nr:hypothetical protein [Desulfovibrio sp. TomC]KHK02408.1 hypothetical protein NY78_2166 [Desulfovibrio sp. TomC]
MKRLFALLLLFAVLLPGQAQANAPLSPETRKELSDFFSPFAAANMKSFDQGTLTEKDLLSFAIWHCIMHPDPALKRINSGNGIVIPPQVIDTITRTFFDRTIKKHRKAQYVESLGSGEAFVFAQADSLRQRDDGTFLAAGTIYYTGAGETIDPYATRAQWKRSGADVRVWGTFTGVLRRTAAPQARWVLLQYAVKETQ